MAARKAAAPKASGVAQTGRTSTTRGKTFQEVTADDDAKKVDQPSPGAEPATGEAAKGYYGEAVDPTPNENYTLPGVLADKPVPETDR